MAFSLFTGKKKLVVLSAKEIWAHLVCMTMIITSSMMFGALYIGIGQLGPFPARKEPP